MTRLLLGLAAATALAVSAAAQVETWKIVKDENNLDFTSISL